MRPCPIWLVGACLIYYQYCSTCQWPNERLAATNNIEHSRGRRRKKEAEIAELRPKALVGEAVETSKASYTVTEAVRYVAQVAPSIKRQDVFDMLRSRHMMVKNGTAPTRAGIDTGRMVAVLHEFTDADGEERAKQQGRLTGKGLAWLVSMFVEGEVA